GFLRFFARVLCGIVASYLGALGSAWVGAWLFAINAPGADSAVRDGYGFVLYVSAVGGVVMGPLTAAGLISRSSSYCVYCGAITALILLALMPYYGFQSQEFW